MRNPKHTPGPISIDREHLKRTDEILLCRDAGSKGNGELVAKVYGDYGFALKAAAAPELLEASTFMVKALEEHGKMISLKQVKALKLMLYAINKATGCVE